MRIRLLKDPCRAISSHFFPPEHTPVAANDSVLLGAAAPNPARTYLLSLAAGSRRTMTQALSVIANIVQPGTNALWLDWATISYADIAKVRSALVGQYAPATANKMLAALRGALKATYRLGLIDADSLARTLDFRPIRGCRTHKGRCLDGGEIGHLLAACDRSSNLGARNAALVAIGFGCGLRRAELIGLDTGDLLERGAALKVRGKGNKERMVYLPDWCQPFLGDWLLRRGDLTGPLFCPMRSGDIPPRRLTEQTVYDVIRSLARKAQIAEISPHDLRRSFVSTLLDNGVPLSTVSAMAGHSDISTTARYDLRGERVKRAAAKLLSVATPTENALPPEPRSAAEVRP